MFVSKPIQTNASENNIPRGTLATLDNSLESDGSKAKLNNKEAAKKPKTNFGKRSQRIPAEGRMCLFVPLYDQ